MGLGHPGAPEGGDAGPALLARGVAGHPCRKESQNVHETAAGGDWLDGSAEFTSLYRWSASRGW
ncbi:hypothetical protein LBMAG42_32440 [Deltaproteobacteria bacterium]|nr:hypothetical protein LBMAG42_32440 [Deltaproteobacteria bacterium]